MIIIKNLYNTGVFIIFGYILYVIKNNTADKKAALDSIKYKYNNNRINT